MVFRDNGLGSFEAASGEELEPGWRTYIGCANFSGVVNDPLVREPFVRVFVWTLVFAPSASSSRSRSGSSSRSRSTSRASASAAATARCSSIPYAVPGFLSLLVWAGLLNDDFGVVNNLLHTSIPWLFDPTWAKVSVIARQRLAHVPVLLPRLDGRAAVDPRRADRGGARRRRRRAGRSSAR